MSAEAPQRSRLGTILILGGLSAFGPLSIDMYLPGLPRMTHDLGASASTGQLTLTACVLGLAVGQLVAGPISDSRGRRGPLLVGLVAYIATSVVCALSPTIWALIVLRLFQGMAGAVGIVIARAIVRDLYEGEEAAKVFSLLMLVMGTAPVFAPLVGGQALRVMSWRGIFVVLAALGAALLAVTALRLRETLPAAERHAGGLVSTLRIFRRLAGDRTFMPYAVSLGLGFGALFAYISGSPFVLEKIYGVSPQVFSLVFAINSALLIAATQVVNRVVLRTGSVVLLRAGLVATAVAGAALLPVAVLHGGIGWVLACLLVLVAGIGLMIPTGNALAMAEQGWAAGSASALLGLAQFLVAAVVAPLSGIAGQGTAVPMAVVIATCGVAAVGVELAAHGRFGVRRGLAAARERRG
jgi:MFS transporter, DHA1 family, multidrug resistance protein